MIIEAIIIGIIIGMIRKGRIDRLSYQSFNMHGLILIAAICYFSINIMTLGSFDNSSSLYFILLSASYILIAIFLIVNLDTRFMFIPLIGLLLNLACMFVNKMRMPVSEGLILSLYGEEMQQLLLSGKIKFFIPLEGAKFSFLAKWIPLGKYYFYRIIPSIGDIIIFIGVILVVQGLMTDRFLQSRNNLKFSRDLFK